VVCNRARGRELKGTRIRQNRVPLRAGRGPTLVVRGTKGDSLRGRSRAVHVKGARYTPVVIEDLRRNSARVAGKEDVERKGTSEWWRLVSHGYMCELVTHQDKVVEASGSGVYVSTMSCTMNEGVATSEWWQLVGHGYMCGPRDAPRKSGGSWWAMDICVDHVTHHEQGSGDK
jgi:hypothetical protein